MKVGYLDGIYIPPFIVFINGLKLELISSMEPGHQPVFTNYVAVGIQSVRMQLSTSRTFS